MRIHVDEQPCSNSLFHTYTKSTRICVPKVEYMDIHSILTSTLSGCTHKAVRLNCHGHYSPTLYFQVTQNHDPWFDSKVGYRTTSCNGRLKVDSNCVLPKSSTYSFDTWVCNQMSHSLTCKVAPQSVAYHTLTHTCTQNKCHQQLFRRVPRDISYQ